MSMSNQGPRLAAAALVALSCLSIALAGHAARAGAQQLDGQRGARPAADAGLTPEASSITATTRDR